MASPGELGKGSGGHKPIGYPTGGHKHKIQRAQSAVHSRRESFNREADSIRDKTSGEAHYPQRQRLPDPYRGADAYHRQVSADWHSEQTRRQPGWRSEIGRPMFRETQPQSRPNDEHRGSVYGKHQSKNEIRRGRYSE